MRGDLIETLKIVNGFTDYGRDWFQVYIIFTHELSDT